MSDLYSISIFVKYFRIRVPKKYLLFFILLLKKNLSDTRRILTDTYPRSILLTKLSFDESNLEVIPFLHDGNKGEETKSVSIKQKFSKDVFELLVII